mmetsp:Transcript_23373/g.56688  ORF Transcript_23373/g.56688 Transcript_23373/m.56688 type:complete len:85 (+) Transcript_23373:434-688(+)
MGPALKVPVACEKVIADNMRAVRMMGWPVLKEDVIPRMNHVYPAPPSPIDSSTESLVLADIMPFSSEMISIPMMSARLTWPQRN